MLLILISACSSNDQPSPRVILNAAPGTGGLNAFSLELDQVFGGTESTDDDRSLIGYIGSVGVHESGEVYVLDSQGNDIVAFRPDGTVKWRKGESGEGPGEIRWPSKLMASADELTLVNQGGSRIDRFDLDGNYLSSFRRPEAFSPECVLPDGRLLGDDAVRDKWRLRILATTGAPEMDSLSVLVDVAFDYDQPAGSGADIAVTACAGTEILVVNPGAYVVDRYSLDGRYVGSFGRSDVGWEPPLTVTGGAAVTVPSFLPHVPLHLGDGGYFVAAQWLRSPEIVREIAHAMLNGTPVPTREWQHSLDLYDQDGILIGSISGDGESPIGRPIASIGRNTIYTYVNSPVPQVRRYDVDLN